MDDQRIDTLFLHDVYQRISAQDDRAVNDLVQRVSGRLERLTRKMLQGFPGVHRWEDTGDVLQTALVKLVRALEEVRPESTRDFVGFAAEQIRRTLIDLARHYRGPEGLGANYASGAVSASAVAGVPDLQAMGQMSCTNELHQWSLFHEAVGKLPAIEREVFSLSYYHGWKQTEIAELLQVSERTVRRFWKSACEQLLTLVGRELNE